MWTAKLVSGFANLLSVAVVDAQIVNVAVSKLTAGTITTAGVMNFTSGADIIMRRTASDTNLIKFQNTSGIGGVKYVDSYVCIDSCSRTGNNGSMESGV
jgi:hypothetical protein